MNFSGTVILQCGSEMTLLEVDCQTTVKLLNSVIEERQGTDEGKAGLAVDGKKCSDDQTLMEIFSVCNSTNPEIIHLKG